jgi:glycosyltransferase involved in cell wall biosynthesis
MDNRISANIICKNEIGNIGKCIDSILDYVYEVIVVDTGSTDGTFEYLQALEKKNGKVRLYHKEWNNNFADMRNYALELSDGDYILLIDGDMTLTNFEFNEGADYYICTVQVYNDKTDNTFNLPITMFFKNNGVRFYGARHATIERDMIRLGGTRAKANIIFSHPVLEASEIRLKMINNLDVHLKQLVSEPDNTRVYYDLCRTYYYLRYYNECIKYGVKVLESGLNKDCKATAAILIYLCYSFYDMEQNGLPFLTESLQIIPKQVCARYLLFLYFLKHNKELALQTYEEIEAISKTGESDLPADIILNQKQLDKIKGDLQNAL